MRRQSGNSSKLNVCPFCKGVKRTLTPWNKEFACMIDPAYEANMKGTWSETFYVCAACMGTGKATVAAARALDGTLDRYKKNPFYRNTSR